MSIHVFEGSIFRDDTRSSDPWSTTARGEAGVIAGSSSIAYGHGRTVYDPLQLASAVSDELSTEDSFQPQVENTPRVARAVGYPETTGSPRQRSQLSRRIEYPPLLVVEYPDTHLASSDESPYADVPYSNQENPFADPLDPASDEQANTRNQPIVWSHRSALTDPDASREPNQWAEPVTIPGQPFSDSRYGSIGEDIALAAARLGAAENLKTGRSNADVFIDTENQHSEPFETVQSPGVPAIMASSTGSIQRERTTDLNDATDIVDVESAVNEQPPEIVQSEIEPPARIVEPPADPVWPIPGNLHAQLQELQKDELATQWAGTVIQLLDLLATAPSLDDPSNAPVFIQLDLQLKQLEDYTRQAAARGDLTIGQMQLFSNLKRFHYGLTRQLSIWRSVYKLASDGYPTAARRETNMPQLSLAAAGRTVLEPLDATWESYLHFNEARREFRSLNPDPVRQKIAARRVLSRLHSPVHTDSQRAYLNENISPGTVAYLKQIAASDPDLEHLLKCIEQIESGRDGYNVWQLNDIWQDLVWSDDPRLRQLADQIDTDYRNANFRIAINGRTLNRMIPQMPATMEPVSENVLGAHVSGQSRIQNSLFVRLIPDPQNIHFNIETAGSVHSDTTARASGVSVQNQGLARFQVFKRLRIGRDGVVSDRPVSWADASQQVVGLHSNYDPIPLVGWIARKIARNKIAEQEPVAREMVQQRVAAAAEEKIQQEVELQMQSGRDYLYKNLLQPLVAMDLDPEPVQLATTTSGLVARYRLAGRDQMGANTCRPEDLPGALANVQIHSSAINNMLMRTELSGRTFTADEFMQHLQTIFVTDALKAGEDAANAKFEFASHDPLRVDFDNDKITLTLNLATLQIGKRKRWRNLRVRSTYRPEARGTGITLVQEKPGIHLLGKRLSFRDQLALRTLFTALLEDSYEMEVIPPTIRDQLAVSGPVGIASLNLKDGWIGIAIADLPGSVPANGFQPLNANYPANPATDYNGSPGVYSRPDGVRSSQVPGRVIFSNR